MTTIAIDRRCGAMLLDSHGGGVGGPGEGEYIQSVEEDHQDWEDCGSSLRSVIVILQTVDVD